MTNMCGIVLMINGDKSLLNKTDKAKAFTQGVIVDTLRGHHSTGLAYVDWAGCAEIYKKPIPGYDFVNMHKYDSVVSDITEYPYLIAHNRFATKGKINTANAHPFQHGNITGVHNGSLWTYEWLASDESFETDSEYVIHALANKDTGDVLRDLDGSFALVWHDASDNTLHLARNKERPFYLAHIKGSKTILGASEEEMLDLICYRNDLKIEEKYLTATEKEIIFSIDSENIHEPQVIERPMPDTWDYYGGNRYNYRRIPAKISGDDDDDKDPVGSTMIKKFEEFQVMGTMHGLIKYYSNSGYGYINATEIGGLYNPLRIQGLITNQFTKMDKKDGYFIGTVVNEGTDEDGNKYLSLTKESVVWLTTDEMYAQYHEFYVSEEDDDDEEEDEGTDVKKLEYRRGNTLYTEEEAKSLVSHGCGICGSPIPLTDFNDLDWWNHEPICVDCEHDHIGYGTGV